MESLSVRICSYVEENPGVLQDRAISDVVDFRHEKASDAERVIRALASSGRIYPCSIYDTELNRFVSFLYPADTVPDFVRVDSGNPEAFRCPFRPFWRTVYLPFAIPSFRKRREVRKRWKANGSSLRSCPRMSS